MNGSCNHGRNERTGRSAFLLVSALLVAFASQLSAQDLRRSDALAIAESFCSHRWQANEKNVRHGNDGDGVEVHTPDRASGIGNPIAELWMTDAPNVGVAYKWGGFDTLASFDAGLRAGKVAGDVYNAEKRRLGGAAVSSNAVGVDCSGFVSRCWKLASKHSTDSLTTISRKLASPSELLPADIMNQPGGHVLLFANWVDDSKTRALFYEAAPFSKVRAKEYTVTELEAAGFSPRRFQNIRD